MDSETLIPLAIALVGGALAVAAVFMTFKESRSQQTTWCYCPGCKRDLVNNPRRVVTDTDLVRYYCLDCYTVSKWDFDFPAPILVDSYYLDPNDWLK